MKSPSASLFATFASLLGATAGVFAVSAGAQQQPSTPPPLTAPSLPSAPPAGAPKVEAPPSAGQSLARQLNEAFVNVFQHVAPAVVVVDVSKENDGPGDAAEVFGDFFNFHPQPDEDSGGNGNNGKDKDKDSAKPPGPPAPSRAPRPRRSQSEGSGFVIQPDGYILTNNHVVTGASKIDVRLRDGRSFPARLIGADEKTDIAVIKVDAQSLPTIEFVSDSDNVRVGELCFAIGVPYKQEYTFTQGVVSAKNRDRLNMAQYEDYIQTDASINPGNSGGPLLDLDGHVIGMNTLINGFNRGLGFAIPSNMLRDVGGQLVKNGRIIRPYLGVRIETLTEAANTRDAAIYGNVKKGVIVISMEMDAPAAKSDLRPADVITEVDGVPVGTDRELQKQVLGKKVGQVVQLTVVRKGKTLKVPVTTRELPGEGPVTAAATPSTGDRNKENPVPTPPRPVTPDAVGKDKTVEKLAASLAGLQVDKLTREVAENLGLDASETGVVVTRVIEDSPAGRAGIQVKDVITEVGNRPVNDTESLRDALRGGAADPKSGTLIYLARGGARTFVVLKGS